MEEDSDVGDGFEVIGHEVDAELARLREEFNVDDDEGRDDQFFFVKVLGGKWTAANKRVVADACGGYARKGLAQIFCDTYSLPKQAAFYFTKFTNAGSQHLARDPPKDGSALS